MRNDMTRILVHRGKGNTKWSVKPARRKNRSDYENMPKRAAVGRGYRDRSPDEYFGPFKRFLVRRIGRPWNDVYSEIRANLRVETAVHLHVLQHLEGFVVPRGWMEDGKLMGVNIYGGITELTWSRFRICYVDEEGILRGIPAGRRPRRKKKK